MRKSLFLFLVVLCLAYAAAAQTTTFTYQGSLTNGGSPANGTYLMEFRLFDALSGGTQIGTTVSDPSVPVANGIFSVSLDFGASGFTGAERYLQISVKTSPGDTFTTLSPRNRVTSTPYAIKSAGAANADLFGGQPPSAYSTSAQVTALQNQVAQLQAELAATTGGTHLWSKRFGATNNDPGYSVAVDGAGNVFITGFFIGTVSFGGASLVSAGGSVADIFVAKFSGPTGAHIWSKRFGGTSIDIGRAIAVDGNGDVFLTGYFFGTTDFGGPPLTSAGATDIFLAKLTGADGSHVWSRRFGSTGGDEGNSVAVDAAGNVLVTGYFNNSVDFGGLPLTSAGGSDIFAAKYSGSTSSHLWSKRFGGSSADFGQSIATDAVGNVYISGYFFGSVDFGGGVLTSAGSSDAFLLKLGAVDGAHIWSKHFGGNSNEAGWGVAADGSGNVFLTGNFSSPTINFGGGGLTNLGFSDAYLAKFNSAGVHQWSKSFGGPSFDDSYAVALDSGGNVLITGSFSGTASFGGQSLNSAGGDLFVAKYSNADGSHHWSRRYGSTGSDVGRAIAVDAAGDLFLTGTFASPTLDFGGGPLVNAEPGFPSDDILLVKLKK